MNWFLCAETYVSTDESAQVPSLILHWEQKYKRYFDQRIHSYIRDGSGGNHTLWVIFRYNSNRLKCFVLLLLTLCVIKLFISLNSSSSLILDLQPTGKFAWTIERSLCYFEWNLATIETTKQIITYRILYE